VKNFDKKSVGPKRGRDVTIVQILNKFIIRKVKELWVMVYTATYIHKTNYRLKFTLYNRYLIITLCIN